MTDPDHDLWNRRVDAVWAAYDEDSEEGHAEEDRLLEAFVKAVRDDTLTDAAGIAELLHDRLLSQERTRWYA